jgi:hypothetical protein
MNTVDLNTLLDILAIEVARLQSELAVTKRELQRTQQKLDHMIESVNHE